MDMKNQTVKQKYLVCNLLDRHMLYAFLLLGCLVLALPGVVMAFGESGCGAGECRDCHSLTAEEAMKLLPPGADKVNAVDFSEVGPVAR